MRRLTARLLLMFALVGSLAPLALAATVAQPHACCLRKGARQHHCDEAGVTPSQLAIGSPACGDHSCCRALTSAQWAHPQARGQAFAEQGGSARVLDSQPESAIAEFSEFQSTRAPPFSIA